MPKMNSASVTATTKPLNAATHTRFFSTTRTKKSVRTGSADTAVDSGWLPNGSYSCDQDMPGAAYGRGRYVLVNPLRVLVTLKLPSCCAVTWIRYAGMWPAAPGPPGPAGPPARGAGGAPGVGAGVVRIVAIVAGSSTLAMNRAGAFSRPTLYDQCNCHKSSMPTVSCRPAN